MTSIRELDAVTIGQIAAGEIIERPASVVKELVENAVDAGATRIAVNVARGGLDLIEVIDDGSGIAPDDLTLALRRHATSKLRTAGELESIATLGFRGEGLASIAAVSHTEILSRQADRPMGSRIGAHAEEIGPVEPAAEPTGTCVRVCALFENVPVRREFLRSTSAEFNRISSWLSTFSLAYPQRTFALCHDGKDVWVMPAGSDDRERLAMVFGRRAAETLLPLEDRAARMLHGELRGFISAPGFDRPDRRMQVLFVNGRLMRGAMLAGAWTSGYSTFAMAGRHPYGVIFLDLPASHVDSNVHPTKSEVRLRYGGQVFDVARHAIAATLQNHARERFAEGTPGIGSAGVSFAPAASQAQPSSLFDATTQSAGGVPDRRMQVLMQLDRTFILASDGGALLLVDQHAAHERIAYESIRASVCGCASSEPLLMPQIVELDPVRSATLDRTIDLVRETGLEIEPFGERTYRIVATPIGYGARSFDVKGFLDDLSDEPKQRDVRERVWASLACHSVTVAGERLAPEEMTTLVEGLQACENPMHCPHGRPTMVRLGYDEIARMFKRV
ncbi:MAG: DNA mismatch repair endonuclease MutL [Candidatus Eremiobacteraeota bacterium]|nr:DNA mismatch repair endonuclease MutL [Candidatus Eremiobacteraeota bacterium]